MRKSILFLTAAVALVASSELALAKHRLPQALGCPTTVHYFSWFTTYSDVCLEDTENAQWLRMFKGKGPYHETLKVAKPI